jgi:hypothetical protein
MSLINFFKQIFQKKSLNEAEAQEERIYDEKPQIEEKKVNEVEIVSVWDVIKCTEHTQAYHLVSVIPFDEWIDMNEIRRRVWDLFQIEYKNDRSLYPYLKTMVDLSLIETANIGGKRKWRKRDLLVKLSKKEAVKEEIESKITV